MVLLILIPLGVIIVLTFTGSSIEYFFLRTIGYMCIGVGFIAAFSLYSVFPRILAGLEQTQEKKGSTDYACTNKYDVGMFMVIFLGIFGIDLVLSLVQGAGIIQSDILLKATVEGIIAAVFLMFIISLQKTDKAE